LKVKPGRLALKTELHYEAGRQYVVMLETVVSSELLTHHHTTYKTKNVFNEQFNTFEAISEEETKWVSESVFHMSGATKLMEWFLPWMFKNQSKKAMTRFKEHMESNSV